MERLVLLGTPAEVRHEDGTTSTVIGYRHIIYGSKMRVTEVLTADGSIPATPAARAAIREAGAL